MPIREYGCQNDKCGHTFEVIAGHCSEDLTTCPKCNEVSLTRLFSQTAPPILKGRGFHSNDYNAKKPR